MLPSSPVFPISCTIPYSVLGMTVASALQTMSFDRQSVRTKLEGRCRAYKIESLWQLATLSATDLRGWKGVSEQSIASIQRLLGHYGLTHNQFPELRNALLRMHGYSLEQYLVILAHPEQCGPRTKAALNDVGIVPYRHIARYFRNQ